MLLRDTGRRYPRDETPASSESFRSALSHMHRRFSETRFSLPQQRGPVSPSLFRREIFPRRSPVPTSSTPGSTSDYKSRPSLAVAPWSSSRRQFAFRIQRCPLRACPPPANSTSAEWSQRNFDTLFFGQRSPVSDSNRGQANRPRPE